MGKFDEDVKQIMSEVLEDGTIDQIIREKIVKGIDDAIENSFRWGGIKKTIEKKVEETMIPYIEKYDFSKYLIKLDTVLTELVNSTVLQDNKRLLENFRFSMEKPLEKDIKLSQLFGEYADFVAEEIDTYGREVDTDDEPTYVGIDIDVSVEYEDPKPWSSRECATIEFSVEEEDQQETLNRSIRVHRWKDFKDNKWHVADCSFGDIYSMRYMNHFDLLIMKLMRADIPIDFDIESDTDYVIPDERPEASFS